MATERLPEIPDVWAPVGYDGLPTSLVAAFERQDWRAVRRELSTVMDGAITDGIYGRQLLQLVLELPANRDPVFDRYRVAAMVDHGDWDALRESIASAAGTTTEINGVRDILTASIDQSSLPTFGELRQQRLFEIYEYQSRRALNLLKHCAHRMSREVPRDLWQRTDVPIGRHLRYRRLQDTTLLAVGEAHSGRLEVAHALASEAQRLGDPSEPLRFVAVDIENLVRLAMGDRVAFELTVPARLSEPCGPSPVGAAEMLLDEIAFLSLRDDDSSLWAAKLLEYIAVRIASPRWELHAQSWRVACELHKGTPSSRTELPGLIARARRATPGLKCLPVFLQGYAQRTYDSFAEAEHLARRSGNTWLQLSALTWMTSLDLKPMIARRLRRLIDVTGWRRPVLVPTSVAADAALGMTSLGERSESILEMALTADRPNVTTELVRRYIDDPATPPKIRIAAVDALARVGTTHAREILSRLAQRRDDIGKAASSAERRPGVGLSEREIEVLSLTADGLTNKQIAEKLFLSPHTIARHLANARAKLGASNRAEAAVRLHRASND